MGIRTPSRVAGSAGRRRSASRRCGCRPPCWPTPRSYEHFLLGLLFPALLHLAACPAMVGALGRELRDGSAGTWLAEAAIARRRWPAKLAPYLLLFTAYGTLSLLWLAAIRGGVAGSAVLLVAAGGDVPPTWRHRAAAGRGHPQYGHVAVADRTVCGHVAGVLGRDVR